MMLAPRLFVVLASLSLLGVSVTAARAAPGDKTLRSGEFTILYQPGLERQAREMALVARRTLAPRLAAYAKQVRLVDDPDRAAAELCRICGASGEKPSVVGNFRVLHGMAQIPLRLFRRFYVVRAADVREGRIKVVGATYDAEAHHLNMEISFGPAAGPESVPPYIPVGVDDDGRLEAGDAPSIDASLAGVFDRVAPALSYAPLHELAEGLLVFQRHLYHPYARWFNDGLADWLAIRLAARLTPGIAPGVAAMHSAVGGIAGRGSVNLLAWPQLAFLGPAEKSWPDDVTNAHYTCAAELWRRLLAGQPDTAVARILAKLHGARNPDTDTLCKAITAVTGRDSKSMLLTYVPAQVREGLRAKRPAALLADARAKEDAGDHATAQTLLTQALGMEPASPALHYELAAALRKLKRPADEVDLQLRLVLATAREFEPDVKGDPDRKLLVGRLFELHGDRGVAEQAYRRVLEQHPGFTDAQRALDGLAAGPTAPR